MKILLSLMILFLMSSCGVTSTSHSAYIESEEDYFSYMETLKPWADSVEQLNGDSYFQAMSTQICNCLTKVNFGLLKNMKQMRKGIASKDSTKYFAAGITVELAGKMIISRPKDRWHRESEIKQIRALLSKMCPDLFSKLDDYNEIQMKAAADDIKELMGD